MQREMKGGRTSEGTLQRTRQGFTLQEISNDQEFTHAKYRLGRVDRLGCHFGSNNSRWSSSATLAGRGPASGSEVHVSDDSGGSHGEGREICAPQWFDKN